MKGRNPLKKELMEMKDRFLSDLKSPIHTQHNRLKTVLPKDMTCEV